MFQIVMAKVSDLFCVVHLFDVYPDNSSFFYVGKHAEWLPYVDKLIIEMLANRTPPTCVQANLYAMAKVIMPNFEVIKELPSLRYIRNSRTTLWLVTKTLAAYQLGKAKDWKQLHTDETSRCQTSLVNVVMSYLMEDDEFRTICLNSAIIAENVMASSQSRAIIGSFQESATLLKKWHDKTAELFPNELDLKDGISDPSTLDVT